jgi:hypothetical protein
MTYILGQSPRSRTTDRKRSNPAQTKKKELLNGSLRQAVLLCIYVPSFLLLRRHFLSPVLKQPLTSTFQHPTYPLQILSSVSSVTGLIVVGQALPIPGESSDNVVSSVRYLRAAHSLLGGVWTHERVTVIDPSSDESILTDSFGDPLGDSIYGVFVLQEAARLVNSTAKTHFNNALIMYASIALLSPAINTVSVDWVRAFLLQHLYDMV